MQTNIEKLTANTTLTKLLCVKQISEIIGKEFSLQLKRAELYYKASENYKLQETKDELKKLNINFTDKYDYFAQFFGTQKSMSAKYIRVGALDSQVIADYVASTKNPNITELDKFSKGDKDSNLTAEGITEKTETEKPAKFSTTKKGIDIKVNSGATAEDIAEAINYLQSLQK